MFITPPYLPGCTHLCGMTYGFSGSRSSTGGRSLPILGDCWKEAGLGNGSVTEPTASELPPPELSPPPGEVPPPPLQALSTAVPATSAEPYRKRRRESCEGSILGPPL